MSEQLSYYARDLLEQGQDFVIAKVVDTKGSAPRKKGAVLLMRQDGSTIGTVGGGLLEAETEKLCRKTFETREKSRIYEFTLDEKQKGALDMGCGGDATIQIDYISADDPRSDKAHHSLDSRRLTRSVFSDEAHDITAGQRDIYISESKAFIPLFQMLYLYSVTHLFPPHMPASPFPLCPQGRDDS